MLYLMVELVEGVGEMKKEAWSESGQWFSPLIIEFQGAMTYE